MHNENFMNTVQLAPEENKKTILEFYNNNYCKHWINKISKPCDPILSFKEWYVEFNVSYRVV